MPSYLVALDQGTTSSRAVVFDQYGQVVAVHGIEFPQIYPRPGWVEHDPRAIIDSQVEALRQAVRKARIPIEQIAAIGIANQRETTLLWNRHTGQPVCNAIVWQCRRTAPLVEQLLESGMGSHIRRATGLIPDAYFSGTKLSWMLQEYDLYDSAERGDLCFGTVDSYLAWNLIEGRPHVTDVTNASRTMLFNIHTLDWDEAMLEALSIPRAVLPRVCENVNIFGMLDVSILGRQIPVAAMAGDQHAALFGQACFTPGMVKNTYGTGCFMLANIGDAPVESRHQLINTIAWRIGGKTAYALEGSVFVAGAAIQWLRDEMGLIERAADSEALALSLTDNGGVYLVPAFAGLGAPWWDMYSRGAILGLTRGAGRAHIVRAALESIAYQSYDLLEAIGLDCGRQPSVLRVDGGASANAFLMQFQTDLLQVPVARPRVIETTALGAAWMAGLGVGLYQNMDELAALWQEDLILSPNMSGPVREQNLAGWRRAVGRARHWIERDTE